MITVTKLSKSTKQLEKALKLIQSADYPYCYVNQLPEVREAYFMVAKALRMTRERRDIAIEREI